MKERQHQKLRSKRRNITETLFPSNVKLLQLPLFDFVFTRETKISGIMRLSTFITVFSAALSFSDAFCPSPFNDSSFSSTLSTSAGDCDYHKESSQSSLSRRAFVSSISSLIAATSTIAKADDTENVLDPAVVERTFLRGKVTTKSDVNFPEDTSSSALYITARPNKADNVPRAILDGSNGKPPPVLVARFANPQFRFEFSLSTADLTQEGVSASEQNHFWFEGQDLIVSARWDTDGNASTRDPTDLVGRSQYASKGGDDAIVQLEGRGMTGKFVTGKATKR